MPRTREGELLGDRYRVEGPDGEGWAATDLTSGQRVHIAFVPRTALGNIDRAKQVQGARIVRVLDGGETPEGATWIVRQHVASESVTKHLARNGAMKLHDAVECALAVCDAIAEANVLGLVHGALDASNVYLAWSASGLVDVQVAGIGTTCPARPRDDVRSIVKLIDAMLGGRTPEDVKDATRSVLRVLDLADTLVPFAQDREVASDRVAARRRRSSTSSSVFAEGGYAQTLPELAPAVRTVPPKPTKSLPTVVVVEAVSNKEAIERDMPTIVGKRPLFVPPRRRTIRIIGVATAALSVALLVLIGTEGARIAQSSRAHGAAPAVEVMLPPAAPIAPPAVTAADSAAARSGLVPVVRPADLPPAKPSRKRR